MNRALRIVVGFFALLLGGGSAVADMQPGDKPTLQFADFLTHKSVNLSDLKGKIVVVDFWATWCGPCMAEAAHMVAVNEKYSGKGMQFLGISLDDDPSALKNIIAEKKFTWPMSYEGRGWEGSTPKAWGVNSIPQTFIIGPDGDVLWRGHPANIDAAIESAFKDHPPQLVDPKRLAQAGSALDQVDKLLDEQQPAKALKLLASVPDDAKADAAVAARMTRATDRLTDFGNSELAAVDSLIQSQQYAVAIPKLRDLSQAFAGTPVAVAAKSKLVQLGSDPKVKQELDAEKTEKEAADALVVAKQLKADKKDELAYPRFKAIVKIYSKTAAAAEAAVVVKTYEADTVFIARLSEKTNGKKAESMLSMADNYRSNGENDLARKKYQAVIDAFPNSRWAETAQTAIAGLGN
jgi:thiol-disulfide isomerase/thioredoxin